MENPKARKPLVLFGYTLKYDRNCGTPSWVSSTPIGDLAVSKVTYWEVSRNKPNSPIRVDIRVDRVSWQVSLNKQNSHIRAEGATLHEAALAFQKLYEERMTPLFKFGVAVAKPLPATPLPLKRLLNGFSFDRMPSGHRKGTEYQVAVIYRGQGDNVHITEGLPQQGRWWVPRMRDTASWGRNDPNDLHVVLAWRKKSDDPLFTFGLAKFPEKECALDTSEDEVKEGPNEYFVVQDNGFKTLYLTRAKPYVSLNKDGSLYAHSWSIRDGAELAIHGRGMRPDWADRVIACKKAKVL